MKNIIIGLIICAVGNNHIFGNVVLIEQDNTYTFKITDEETAQESSFNDTNGNTRIKVEPYTDFNNNGKYDYGEEYIDNNQNGIWDNDESFQDLNQNGICDIQEPFIDKGNGIYDIGEEFVDVNGNNKCDLELWYVDNNRNGKWDDGEPFDDLNNNDLKDYKEPFTDLNNNNKYDAPEKTGDFKFTFSAIAFSEPFIDIANGKYDLGEEYEDLNGDGKWTAGNEQHDQIKKSILNQQDVDPLIYDTLKTSLQNDIIFNKSPYKRSFKSPGKALLYSGVLPGIGQAYMGNWMRALLFVSIDVAAIGTWYHNNNLAEDKKREYSYYANDHWDFGRWVHDYYKWYPTDTPNWFSGHDTTWRSIREVFTNYSDSTYGCAQDPTQGHCYIDIWDHSHKVEFTWEDKIVSSSDKLVFQPILKELCGNNNIWDKHCSNTIEEIEDFLIAKSVIVIPEYHFHEGIQKYNYYFAGWDDAVDSVKIVERNNGTLNAQSPHKQKYQALWNDYDTVKRLAVNGGKFMLINRFVSMVDALLLAKKWNNEHDVKLSLNAYPNLRNKSGVGGVKLSLRW